MWIKQPLLQLPQLLQNEEVPHKFKKIKFTQNDSLIQKDEQRIISKSITNSVIKSHKSKESWDEQIAKSDQKMDQATGLISVSESEEERDKEMATANVVESRKKDVKKVKQIANQSTTAAMFGQIGISSDEDGEELGVESNEDDEAEDIDEDPHFLISED